MPWHNILHTAGIPLPFYDFMSRVRQNVLICLCSNTPAFINELSKTHARIQLLEKRINECIRIEVGTTRLAESLTQKNGNESMIHELKEKASRTNVEVKNECGSTAATKRIARRKKMCGSTYTGMTTKKGRNANFYYGDSH